MSAEGKCALITGATSGIGKQLARLFANDGYHLVLVSRNQDELNNVSNELKMANGSIHIVTIAKDLFKQEDVFALCDDVKSKGLQIDVLVNDAGQGLYGLFKDTELGRELDIINLNIKAVVILTKHFLQEMVSRNDGKILFLASIASKTPGPWQSIYHASKAFVLSFAEAIRAEVEDSGITITALMPGVTDTDFFDKAGMLDSKAVQDKESMADPAVVAKDGYDALMAGDDKVVSGFKNKVQIVATALMPDSMVAANVKKEQAPVDK